MSILAAFKTVAVMLLCAVPGFLMIKSRLIKEDSISAIVKILLYICQPCLVVNSITGVEFSKKTALDLVIVFAIVLASELIMTGLMLLVFKRKAEDARYRIYAIASCMGNVSFMGIPVINALLPGNNEAVAYSAAASFALNVFGWTVASAVIAKDKKYISLKKIFLNPATIAIIVSIPLFVTNTKLPVLIADKVSILGHTATPLCMIIMGARLATSSFKQVFLKPMNYVIVATKQLIYPLVVFGILSLLPIDHDMKCAVYIMACCPVASMVLNFSELVGTGQKSAASVMLLGTTLSCLTLPLMILII